MRSCIKKTGPLDVNLISIPIKIINGEENKIAIIDTIISKVRFNIPKNFSKLKLANLVVNQLPLLNTLYIFFL